MKKIIPSMCLTTAASLGLMMGAAEANSAGDSLRTNVDQYGNLQLVLARDAQMNAGMIEPAIQPQARCQAHAEALFVCGSEAGRLLASAENRVTLPSALSDAMQLEGSRDAQVSLSLSPQSYLGGASQLACPGGYRPMLVGVRYDRILVRPEGGAAIQGRPVAWVNNAFSDQVAARETERGTFEFSFTDKGVARADVVELGGQGVPSVDIVERGAQGEMPALGQDTIVDVFERGSQGEMPARGQDKECDEARGSK
ncbi:hypothetical protein [Polyangium aurulentum]|uniref:hypothetical protein n=1 Tax=Polyangium aurulentum TaxID=2567896 RepID=UPI0010AEB1DD|nr:hypothetical protein [Polyangium aurulentum]UQA59374.1 hypothetical protein E8A73_002370 [Polyangium aurulentum]